MNNLVPYLGPIYGSPNFHDSGHRGNTNYGRNNLNKQLKLAEIEAGNQLKDNFEQLARGK
jgi:hypothetical protein